MSFRRFFAALFAVIALTVGGEERVIRTPTGGKVKTLDPALADDLASRNLVGALFDTLVEYDYLARPYALKPAMLAKMPESNADFTRYDFTLRDDLYFADDPDDPLPREKRRITAYDVRFAVLRIADARTHSPLFWIFRSKIVGIDEFRATTQNLAPGDFSCYDRDFPGIKITDDRHFSILLTRSDPRFLYLLAMPNTGVVSRRAVEKYGADFARHPVGSGAFRLEKWIPNYSIDLVRNGDYRTEYFSGAESPGDRKRPLPLADRIEIRQVRQPMSSWLLFLQGEIDINLLDQENNDLAMGGDLSPVLKTRGIRLIRIPDFEIRYVGFNFHNEFFAGNPDLRKALSLAYNIRRRCEHYSGQMMAAQTILPPGTGGYEKEYRNPFAADDYELAKKYLARAGFPDGIDPATGEHLTLTLDFFGNSTLQRQLGEITADDFWKIGIRTTPVLNNIARFYEKIRHRQMQLFRMSWIGDYPDAENFFQLFYSKNRDSCNRTGYCDPVFDRMYEEILPMPDSPERNLKYEKMARYLAEKCPCILEGFPISWILCHEWLENYVPGDFTFNFYKYISVDPARRAAKKATFSPLSMSDLRKR